MLCPFCGGHHSREDCPEVSKMNKKAEFIKELCDERHKNLDEKLAEFKESLVELKKSLNRISAMTGAVLVTVVGVLVEAILK